MTRRGQFLRNQSSVSQIQVLTILIMNFAVLLFIYFPYRESSFTIDDPVVLSTFGNEEISLIDRILETVWAARWRPVSWAYYTFASELFSGSFIKWWLAAVGLMGINIVLFVKILAIMRVRAWAILGLSLIFTTSRFLFGFPLNIAFATEILAVTFILVLLIFLNLFDKTKNLVYVYLTIFLLILLYLTHERFIFVSVYLCVAIGTRVDIPKRIKTLLITLIFVLMTSFMLGKRFFFQIPLLLGTGSATDLGLTLSNIIQFTRQFVLRVLGLNAGETYLSGYTWTIQTFEHRVLSVVLVFLTLGLLLNSFGLKYWERYRFHTERNNVDSNFFLYLLLFFLISGPAVMTIRLEDRWIFIPFMIVLLMIGHGFTDKPSLKNSGHNKYEKRNNAKNKEKPKEKTLPRKNFLVIFVLIHMVMNYSYLKSIDSIYFRWSQVTFEKSLAAVKTANLNALEGNKTVLILHDKSTPEYFKLLVDNIQLKFEDKEIQYLVTDSLPQYRSNLEKSGLLVYEDYLLKVLDLNKSENRLAYTGDLWPDGWAGKRFTAKVVDPRCSRIRVSYYFERNNTVIVSIDNGSIVSETFSPGEHYRSYDLKDESSTATFNFSNVYRLNEINGEVREFSSRVKVKCMF
jgi:hypothetical protein